MSNDVILSVQNLTTHFPVGGKRKHQVVKAVDELILKIFPVKSVPKLVKLVKLRAGGYENILKMAENDIKILSRVEKSVFGRVCRVCFFVFMDRTEVVL